MRMVWCRARDRSTFGPSDQHTMNPIAFIAFLVGINTTPPSQPKNQEQKKGTEQPQPKPAGEVGAPKRGGWDRN